MGYRIADEPRTAVVTRKERRQLRRKRTLAVLPSACTLGNLICGFLAIFIASRSPLTPLPWNWSPLTLGAVFIFLGMVFDALDGRLARLTNNTSNLGAQLDSLADVITFGAAPAFLAVQLVGIRTPFFAEGRLADGYFDRLALAIACIYVACAALRLARFNVEIEEPTEADHNSFKGLPSPGAGGTVASVVLLHQYFLAHKSPEHWSTHASSLLMVMIMLLTAFAMVSKMRYVHVLNRFIRGRAPLSYVAKGATLVLLLLVWPQGSLAAAFVLYAMSAPTAGIWRASLGRMIPTKSRSTPPGTPVP